MSTQQSPLEEGLQELAGPMPEALIQQAWGGS